MRNKLPLIAALLAGALIAVVAVLVLGGGDDDDKKGGDVASAVRDGQELVGPNETFRLQYPKGWDKVSPEDLGGNEGVPVAAVRRDDKSALLVVQRRPGEIKDSTDKLSKELTAQLKKDVNDFRFVRSNDISLPAGKAISYTFVRTKTGRVQNLTVLSKDKVTYTLNSVVAGDAQEAAGEVAAIVRSFEPKD